MKVENNFKQTELGSIPEDWEVVRLRDVAKAIRGVSWKKEEANKKAWGVPVLTIPNIEIERVNFDFKYFLTKQISQEKLLALNDIVFVSSSGSIENIGRNAFLKHFPFDERIAFASFLAVLRANIDKIEPQFLYFLINSKWIDFTKFTKRAADGKYNFQLRDFEENALIPLPPLEEQRKIAKVLDKIQQAIEVQDKIIEWSKNLKKSLMQKLFTEGLYDEERKETEIGLIPQSWEVVRLGGVVDIIMGQSPPSTTYNKQNIGLPFLQGNAEFSEIYPKPIIYCSDPIKVAKTNDILISVRAPVGDINLANSTYAIGRGLAAIRAVKTELYPKFGFYYLKYFSYRLSSLGSGSTFKAVRKKELAEFLLSIPPLPEQQKIAEMLSIIDNKILLEKNRKDLLEKLFKTMLNKLMTGQIRVKDLNVEVFGV